jgi:hypothetical protein
MSLYELYCRKKSALRDSKSSEKMIANRIRNKIRKYVPFRGTLSDIQTQLSEIIIKIEKIQESLGRLESRQLSGLDSGKIQDFEFQVYSQWGEDGIIQFLINEIEIENKIFVELGVEDYTECNTRFLLVNNNWSGLAIDGCEKYVERIKSSKSYWLYNLKVVNAFITRDNINLLLESNGLKGEIGLLSIDIDGNDYWIWDAIDIISPIIVIIEYNHRFGSKDAVTIPYDENFVRSKHHSMIYFGASLKALCILAEKKGYEFIGCSNNGVNAFFVRKDKYPISLRKISPETGYKPGKFCEYRDITGKRVKISPDEEVNLLKSEVNLPLVTIENSDSYHD